MTKNYDDKLPRKVRGNVRCQSLNMDGERCKKKAVIEGSLFEDPAHWGRWVVVYLCYEHASGHEISELKKQKNSK